MFHGIMVNEDDSHFYFTRYRNGENIPIEEVYDFVDQYVGTQVTEFVMCVGGRIADFPSKIRESYVEKYLQETENGRPVNYKKTSLAASMYNLFVEQEIDWYAVAFDRFRGHGISPWASIRMNDCHDNDLPTSVLHPDFYHDNPQLRRVRHRQPTDYFDRCYDYECPEIYDMMIRFVEEVAFRYDVDGIELDWMRENYCFQIGREYPGTETINRFMRDTRKILRRAAEKWGHPIKLGARVMADPIQSASNGFNVLTWAREGLVDVVVPTARWRTTDNDMPIAFWKQMLKDYPITLAAGLEIILSPWRYRFPETKLQMQTVETTQGAAANYLSQGADKIYLFNYMDRAEQFDPAPTHVCNKGNYQTVLRTIGSDQVYAAARRHIVTFADIRPVFTPACDRLPAKLSAGQFQMVRVGVGKIDAGAKVQLVLGASKAPREAAAAEELIVYVNSAPVRRTGSESLNPPYVAFPCATYEIENHGALPPYLVVEVSTAGGEPLTLEYAEIRVNET